MIQNGETSQTQGATTGYTTHQTPSRTVQQWQLSRDHEELEEPHMASLNTSLKDANTIDLALDLSNEEEHLTSPDMTNEPSIAPIPTESAWHEAPGGHGPHLENSPDLTTEHPKDKEEAQSGTQRQRPDRPHPSWILGLQQRRE